MAYRWFKLTILLMVPFLVTGCGLKQLSQTAKPSSTPSQTASQLTGQTTIASVNYATIDPTTLEETIQQNYQTAEQKVKDWKKDAVLYHFSAKLPSDLGVGKATEVYSYGSPSDAYNWWTYNISGKTGKAVRAIIPKEDYLGTTLVPAPTRFWQTNYVEAFQLAEANGGADFRASHPDALVTINLLVQEPKNYLWWSIEYEAVTSEPFKILVNPATKEVFSATGQSLGASGLAPTSTFTSPAAIEPGQAVIEE